MSIDACPYCGHDEYYRKTFISGHTEYRYRFDGGEAYNGHIHDSLDYRESKSTYCGQCHKNCQEKKIKKNEKISVLFLYS
jgi:ferredoxin